MHSKLTLNEAKKKAISHIYGLKNIKNKEAIVLIFAIYLRSSNVKKIVKLFQLLFNITFSLTLSCFKKNTNTNHKIIFANSLTRHTYVNFIRNLFLKKNGLVIVCDIFDYLTYRKYKIKTEFIAIKFYVNDFKNFILSFSNSNKNIQNLYLYLLDFYSRSIYKTFNFSKAETIMTLCDTHFFEYLIVQKANSMSINTVSYQHGEISNVWFPGKSKIFKAYDQNSFNKASEMSSLESEIVLENFTFFLKDSCNIYPAFDVLITMSRPTESTHFALIDLAKKLSDDGFKVIYKLRPKTSIYEKIMIRLKLIFSHRVRIFNKESLDEACIKSRFIISSGSGTIIEAGFYGVPGLNLVLPQENYINEISEFKNVFSYEEILKILDENNDERVYIKNRIKALEEWQAR